MDMLTVVLVVLGVGLFGYLIVMKLMADKRDARMEAKPENKDNANV